MSRRRQRTMRLAVFGAAVAVLTLVALWRVAAPREAPQATAPDAVRPQPIGRPMVLEAAEVVEVPSARTLWVRGGGEDLRFAVLDPDVKRPADIPVQPGARVTLIGLVRAMPRADVAARQWGIDEATIARVAERGDYVYVTEIR